MSTIEPVEAELRRVKRFWWVTALTGILSVIAGVVVLTKPGDSLVTLAIISGIFILIDGVFQIGGAIFGEGYGRGLLALLGALNLVIGIILVRHPIAGIVAVALLIGIWLVIIGVLRLVQAVQYGESRVWNLVLGLLNLIAGVVIISDAHIGLATLALLVGIGFLLNGMLLIITGFVARKLAV